MWPHRWQPPGSPVPGILQARTLEWVAISFSNTWKWKVKGKSLSRVRLLATPWTAAYQAPPSMGFSRQSTGVGSHCLSLKFPRVPLFLCIQPFSSLWQSLILFSVPVILRFQRKLNHRVYSLLSLIVSHSIMHSRLIHVFTGFSSDKRFLLSSTPLYVCVYPLSRWKTFVIVLSF